MLVTGPRICHVSDCPHGCTTRCEGHAMRALAPEHYKARASELVAEAARHGVRLTVLDSAPDCAAPAAESLRRSANVLLDMVAVMEKAADTNPELRAELPGYVATMRTEASHLVTAARIFEGLTP